DRGRLADEHPHRDDAEPVCLHRDDPPVLAGARLLVDAEHEGTLGPYTSASMRPIAGRSVASARARWVATVDLPTPPLPLVPARTRRTPGIGCGPRARGGAGGGACTISTRPVTSGMASTATRTAAAIRSSTSCCAVVGARWIVTPADETSMSFTIPKDTMSRLKPG